MHIEARAIHAGRTIDPATRAVSIPLHSSTTFERAIDGSYPSGLAYIRDANPTRNALEEAVASLEGAETGTAFSSGMAAISAVFDALAVSPVMARHRSQTVRAASVGALVPASPDSMMPSPSVPISPTPPSSISAVVTDRLAPDDNAELRSSSDVCTLNRIAVAQRRAGLT